MPKTTKELEQEYLDAYAAANAAYDAAYGTYDAAYGTYATYGTARAAGDACAAYKLWQDALKKEKK